VYECTFCLNTSLMTEMKTSLQSTVSSTGFLMSSSISLVESSIVMTTWRSSSLRAIVSSLSTVNDSMVTAAASSPAVHTTKWRLNKQVKYHHANRCHGNQNNSSSHYHHHHHHHHHCHYLNASSRQTGLSLNKCQSAFSQTVGCSSLLSLLHLT